MEDSKQTDLQAERVEERTNKQTFDIENGDLQRANERYDRGHIVRQIIGLVEILAHSFDQNFVLFNMGRLGLPEMFQKSLSLQKTQSKRGMNQ